MSFFCLFPFWFLQWLIWLFSTILFSFHVGFFLPFNLWKLRDLSKHSIRPWNGSRDPLGIPSCSCALMRSLSSSPPPPRCSIETLLNLKASLIFSLRVEERGSRAVDWWADIVILDIWWCTWASSLWWLCDYPGGPRSQVESSWLLWPPTQGGRPPHLLYGGSHLSPWTSCTTGF